MTLLNVYEVVPWLLVGWILTAAYAYWLWRENREMSAAAERAANLIEQAIGDAEVRDR